MNDTKTVSGAIVHVTDADEAPLVRCLVDITPKQSGTGTPSPDNVRQISGWESVSVTDAGKNFCLLPNASGTGTGLRVTATDEPSITFDGTRSGSATVTTISAFSLPAGTYILSGAVNGDSCGLQLFNETQSRTYRDTTGNGVTITVNEGDVLKWRGYVGANAVADNMKRYPLLRLASDTDPTYEPYTGQTITTSLGRTVYGGTLDVVSGVLTVDRVGVDMGTLSWTYSTSYPTPIFAVTVDSLGTLKNSDHFMSSIYNSKLRFWTEAGNDYCVASGNGSVNVSNSNYTSASDFKTGMSGTLLVYELATPQTYTLTGQEISTLLGDNNVWADSGDIEITYHTGTLGIYNKIYINGRPYFRPNDFQLAREDVYAGEYTSCTGKLIADKIGWRYSDLPMKWDILPDEDLVYLTTLTGAFDIIFRDSDGQHTEQVIRRGFTNTPTRTTGPEGTKIWTGVEMEVSFLNTHPINE